jgi:hypothetical protein
MIIYFASVDDSLIPFIRSVVRKGDRRLDFLFSFYDLTDLCPIPFRKNCWKKIIDEKGDVK